MYKLYLFGLAFLCKLYLKSVQAWKSSVASPRGQVNMAETTNYYKLRLLCHNKQPSPFKYWRFIVVYGTISWTNLIDIAVASTIFLHTSFFNGGAGVESTIISSPKPSYYAKCKQRNHARWHLFH